MITKISLLTSLLITPITVFAITGTEVIDLVKKNNQNYESETNEMRLIIKENNKVTAERKLKGKILEMNNGEIVNKSLIEFTHPTDVKGTKLLTWLMENEDKSQWIYLPALSKSKRILGSNANASFMGSEFTFSDIGGEATGRFDYKLIQEKKDGDDVIWTVEQKSKNKEEKEYKIVIVRKSLSNPEKTEYFNAKNEKYKEAILAGFKKYTVGKKTLFRPSSITMRNLINRNESVIEWDNREFGAKLNEKDFSAQALERKR
jgi:hypothetical protein